MFPFSVTQRTVSKNSQPTARCGYELIAFDAEKLNVFAARVRYCEPHWHPAPELITVLAGRFAIAVGNQLWQLEPGDMLYINAEAVHSLSAEVPESELITVQFSPSLFDALHPAPRLAFCSREREFSTANAQVLRGVMQLIMQLVEHDAPFLRIAAIYTLLDALLKAGGNDAPQEGSLREEAMIKKGLDYINQHYDRPLSLSDVASHAGMSYSWFSRLFKKVSRHNFKEYLTLVRLNKAKNLLCDTRTPITQISYCCGFQEHKYLIAAFKKYCGLTPTEYRKRYFSPQNAADSRLSLTEDCVCLPLNTALLARLRALVESRC